MFGDLQKKLGGVAAAGAFGAISGPVGASAAAAFSAIELTKQAVDPNMSPSDTMTNIAVPGGPKNFIDAAKKS